MAAEYASIFKDIISGRNSSYVYNYNKIQLEPETRIAASYQMLCFQQLVFM